MIDFEILPKLSGDGVILKLPRRSQKLAEDIFETIVTSRVVFEKWMPWTQKIQTVDDCLRFLTYLRREVRQKDKLQYLIFDKNTNIFQGLICFYDYSPLHKRGEIGIWVDARYHRCHLATDAITTLENYLFSVGIHRLEAHCETDNKSFRALAEKLKYKEIAILKDHRYSTYKKRFCDTVYLYKLEKKS